MTVLIDDEIRHLGDDVIQPFDPARVQPASYDVRLGSTFYEYPEDGYAVDMRDPAEFISRARKVVLVGGQAMTIMPGGFMLASTMEKVKIPSNLVCRIEGKSSVGRLGLMVHVTAGYIDPGFHGVITLEMHNLLSVPLIMHVGDSIAQLSFARTIREGASKPYGHPDLGSHYQGDTETVTSRYQP